MRQVSPKEAQNALEKAFTKWGLPKRIRLDNGYPFANTSDRALPTNLILWTVALGIEPIFNRPRCPQQNGTVECLQRISHKWANPKSCLTTTQLQKKLDKVSFDHIEVYRIRSKNDVTRKELYPKLFKNKRIYNPKSLNINRVKKYLSEFVLTRKVFKNGRFSFAGKTNSVGTKYANKNIFIRFNYKSSSWQAALDNGTIIFKSDPIPITPKVITDLNLISKNF